MPLWKFFHYFRMWNFDKYPRGILVSWSLFFVIPPYPAHASLRSISNHLMPSEFGLGAVIVG